jgi:hypothetical protein
MLELQESWALVSRNLNFIGLMSVDTSLEVQGQCQDLGQEVLAGM